MQVMAGLLQHCGGKTDDTVRNMLESLADKTDKKRTDLAVLFWCKSGTHRSVALAQAYGWVLVQLGAEVIGWVR